MSQFYRSKSARRHQEDANAKSRDAHKRAVAESDRNVWPRPEPPESIRARYRDKADIPFLRS